MLRIFHFALLSIGFFLVACNNDQKSKTAVEKSKVDTTTKAPILDFVKGNYVDLGKIVEGEKISHTYKFVNSGNAPLQISYVNASCGCTVPTWPKGQIPPGGNGEISIVFNSKNKEGLLSKNISIYANTKPEFNNLSFKIEVIKQ
jgi:hypothetical protein